MLSTLSNIDKHRTLHMATARLAGSQCFLVFAGGMLGGMFTRRIAMDESPIAAFQFAEQFNAQTLGDCEVQVDGAAFVAIDEPGPWTERPVAVVLEDVLGFIRTDVVEAISPLIGL